MMIIIIIPAAQIYIPSKTDQEPSDSITKKNEERRTPIYYYQQDKKDSKTIPNEKKSSTTDDKKAKFNRDERRDEIIHLNRKTLLQILSKLQKPILITRISEDQSLDKPMTSPTTTLRVRNQNSFDPEFDSGWRTYIYSSRLYSSTTDYGADSRKNPSSTRAAKVKANG